MINHAKSFSCCLQPGLACGVKVIEDKGAWLMNVFRCQGYPQHWGGKSLMVCVVIGLLYSDRDVLYGSCCEIEAVH